jgi:hypothetical protein
MTSDEQFHSHHDMGGQSAGPVRPSEHDYALWEKRVDALMVLLSGAGKRLITVDELRRGIESIGPDAYDKMAYYERWITSITGLMIEKGVLSKDEIEARVAKLKAAGEGLA